MHEHDQGLAHDLEQIRLGLNRRRVALGLLGAAGGAALIAAAPRRAIAATPATTCAVVPSETAGPFPGNGSGRGGGSVPNALALAGVLRSDIRSSFAGATGVAAGVPLKLNLKLVNAGAGCAALGGHAVYVWHCDREGRYSMYSSGVRDENYLRGVQLTDAEGSVSFATIFPGCYPGRMPHLHFEVYRAVDAANPSAQRLKTSQLALPVEACAAVYAQAAGYVASGPNLGRISFATDMVFRDGVESQLAAVSGSVEAGYSASLTVGIAG